MSPWHAVALAALVLSLMLLVGLTGVLLLAHRLWRNVAPTVTPMLQMMGVGAPTEPELWDAQPLPTEGKYNPAGDTVTDSHGAKVTVTHLPSESLAGPHCHACGHGRTFHHGAACFPPAGMCSCAGFSEGDGA